MTSMDNLKFKKNIYFQVTVYKIRKGIENDTTFVHQQKFVLGQEVKLVKVFLQ